MFLNSITNSLNFLLVFKVFFIRKPIKIQYLKLFTKPINLIIFKLQLRDLFKKKFFKNFVKNKFFFTKINIRQDLLKNFYHERKFFPEARFNFFKLFPYNRKNFLVKKSGLQFCKKEDSIPLRKDKNLWEASPSLQKLILLKKLKTINHFNSNTVIIQYNSFPKFCFTRLVGKISIFLNLLKKENSLFFFKFNNSSTGYYQLININDYKSYQLSDLLFQFKYDYSVSLSQDFDDFNLKLIHCLEIYKNKLNLFLFCEFSSLFSPRISDKIFFRLPRFYFIRKNSLYRKKYTMGEIFSTEIKCFKVIIESNFRLYAYKKKKIHIDIIQQFSETLYHLPNLFVGDLTVKSINKAFKNGISGDNILSFIRNNLHNVCKIIPSNVIEQIKIWELDKRNNFISKVIFASNLNKVWSSSLNYNLNQTIVSRTIRINKIIIFKNLICHL